MAWRSSDQLRRRLSSARSRAPAAPIALSMRGETILEGRQRHLGLLARVEIFDHRGAALELIVADDDGVTRPGLVRHFQRFLQFPIGRHFHHCALAAQVARQRMGTRP